MHRDRVPSVLRLAFFLAVATVLSGAQSCTTAATKPQPLRVVNKQKMPIRELSGLTRCGGHILGVGDRNHNLAQLPITATKQAATAKIYKISGFKGDSQWEAVACDGGGQIFVLVENPPAIVALDLAKSIASYQIPLNVEKKSFPEWFLDPNSMGEGLVVLSKTNEPPHFLVLKEKRPPMLVEFGPVGSPSRMLGPDQDFRSKLVGAMPKPHQSYVVLGRWRIASTSQIQDLSDLEVDDAGRLLAISDQQPFIYRLVPPASGSNADVSAEVLWRLPKGVKQAEGLAIGPAGSLFVGSDRPKRAYNFFTLAD